MDPSILNRMTAVLQNATDDNRNECMQLAGALGGIIKDLRDAFAFAITEKHFAGDSTVIVAYMPHRKDAMPCQTIVNSLRTSINAYGSAGHGPLAKYPEAFDLCAAILVCLEGELEKWKQPQDLAEFAMACDLANRGSNGFRKDLAGWAYSPRGELSGPASALLASAPAWTKEKLDAAIGDSRPQPRTKRRFLLALRDRLAQTWKVVAAFEPAAMLTFLTIGIAVVLFGISVFAGSRSHVDPSLGVPEAVAESQPVVPPSVYEMLTLRLKAKQDILAGAVIVVTPRERDGADTLLIEAVSNADLKDVTILPWSETRNALGGDVPAFGEWLTPAELGRLARMAGSESKDEKMAGQPIFYVDLERLEVESARISVLSVAAKPGVVAIVTGAAAGLQPALTVKSFLDRAFAIAGSSDHEEFARQIRRARTAATNDSDRDQIDLLHALNLIANGKVVDAEKLLRGIWGHLALVDKQRIPEPVRGELERAVPALDQAIRDRLTLKP